MIKPTIFCVALLALCGCIKNKDELTINADGSGKVRLETRTSLPPELAGGMAMGLMRGSGGVVYPPTGEEEAAKFFPGKDFTIQTTQSRADSGEVTSVIEVEFKDINALLASPYGRAHQLTLKVADGALVLRGVSGLEIVARLAEFKDDGGMMMAQMPGAADLQKKKDEMRSEFRVTLPNAVAAANGARDGRTAAWVVERAKCKDADDFALQLGAVSEAKCPAAGIKFSPVTPLRMGLVKFDELADGLTEAGVAVDTNKVAAAAKFIPYGLSVTRTLDLSGSGGGRENMAELTGAVMLPAELAPQKWGQLKLEEAVDAKGNNLKPGNGDAEERFAMGSRFSRLDNDEEADAATNGVQRHVVSVSFRPPDWKIGSIARVRGTVDLQYFGGSQLVKLTNAIPAQWIVESKGMGLGFSSSSEKPLDSAALSRLGLTLSVESGTTIQGGLTMLQMQAKGGADWRDAQVFDAAGKPWPTFLSGRDSGGEGESCQVIIAGKPQPPLSLALQVSGNAVKVGVPVLVENITLTK